MSDATIFYILAGVLAGLAVIVSFIGIKVESFPGKAGPVVVLLFIALIGGATTYSVLNGQHEEEVRAAENEEAGEEIEKEQNSPQDLSEVPQESSPTAEGGTGEKPLVSGPGGTVQLAASPTEIAYDKTKLHSSPGEIKIKFSNPSALGHDVAIFQGDEELGKTEVISESQTETTVKLGPGTYTFLCTVPGHAEAGMEGELLVK